MGFLRQSEAAVVLFAITLDLPVRGMAGLIDWARGRLERRMYRFGKVRSAMLMVRFTSLIIILHLLEILLWAGFYRWKCFPSWSSAFYFSTTSYSTVGYG